MQRIPKVLIVIPGAKVGNKCTFSIGQAAALTGIGIDVRVFYLESRTNPVKLLRSVFEITLEARRSDRNIIHAHFGTVTALVSACASLSSGIPLIVTFHGSDLNNTSSADGYIRDFFQRLFSNLAAFTADSIVCVSEHVKNGLWWRRELARVVPCGIDLSLFRPIDKATCRASLGWDSSAKIIVFNNGSGSPIKRQDIVMEALEIIKRDDPDTDLKILRDLEYSRVPVYLNAADCLVLCSDNEGSPTIIKEALACNLPIVSVPVGDTPEMLRGVRNTKLVRQAPNAIAEAVLDVVSAGRRSDGRAIAAPRFDNNRIVKELVSIYDAMLSGKPALSVTEIRDQIYRRDSALLQPIGLPKGFSFNVWKPAFNRFLPPGLGVKFFFWWLFWLLGVFKNKDYAVLYIKQGRRILHRSCVVPAYFRWPFMSQADLQVSSTWTDPVCRGMGLATIALTEIVRTMGRPGRHFVYVTRTDNPASIEVCRKVGFKLVGAAKRLKLFGIRMLGQLVLHSAPQTENRL